VPKCLYLSTCRPIYLLHHEWSTAGQIYKVTFVFDVRKDYWIRMQNCPSHTIGKHGRGEISTPLLWGCGRWRWQRSRFRLFLPTVTFSLENSALYQAVEVFVASEYYMVSTKIRVNRTARWLWENVGKYAGGGVIIRRMLMRSIRGGCHYRQKWSGPTTSRTKFKFACGFPKPRE
jgi:hypothetical protein